MLELEEEKLSDQRARLAAMKREAKLKELKSLDDARQKYLQQQQTLRELEIEKMDKEIEKKVKFAKKKNWHVRVHCMLSQVHVQGFPQSMKKHLTR